MIDMESETRKIRWQADWLEVIDAECDKSGQSFADFVKDAVAEKIGKRRLPPRRGRGKPPKPQNKD